jgi:hypothetical protein
LSLVVKRPEKRVEVCLDGSLQAEWEAAEAALAEARQRKLMDTRLGDSVHALAEAVRAIEDKARAESVTFLLRGVPRHVWDAFVADHPERDDHELDKAYGYNTETIFDAVLAHNVPKSITAEVPPTIVSVTKQDGTLVKFTPAEWQAFADELTNAQYGSFQVAVNEINRGRTNVPFSPAAYRETRTSGKS